MNAGPAEEPEKSAEVTPQMRKVLDFIKANGQITEKEIGSILGLKKTRAFTVAKQMRDLGLIRAVGRGESKKYVI